MVDMVAAKRAGDVCVGAIERSGVQVDGFLAQTEGRKSFGGHCGGWELVIRGEGAWMVVVVVEILGLVVRPVLPASQGSAASRLLRNAAIPTIQFGSKYICRALPQTSAIVTPTMWSCAYAVLPSIPPLAPQMAPDDGPPLMNGHIQRSWQNNEALLEILDPPYGQDNPEDKTENVSEMKALL